MRDFKITFAALVLLLMVVNQSAALTKIDASMIDTGTDIGDVIILEDVGGSPGLPAVNGSQLTDIDTGTDTGDIIRLEDVGGSPGLPAVDGSQLIGGPSFVSGTPVPTTSGTSITFTDIPVWAKRITINFSGVTFATSDLVHIQLGDSGGVEETGYDSAGAGIYNATIDYTTVDNTGFVSGLSNAYSGAVTLTLLDSATNTWVATGILINYAGSFVSMFGGSKALSGTLDKIKISSFTGYDFTTGVLNITYE